MIACENYATFSRDVLNATYLDSEVFVEEEAKHAFQAAESFEIKIELVCFACIAIPKTGFPLAEMIWRALWQEMFFEIFECNHFDLTADAVLAGRAMFGDAKLY